MLALHAAIRKRDMEAVKKCLSDGDTCKSLNETVGRNTVLTSAIRRDSADIVEVLLHAKADPQLRNYADDTALSLACATSDTSFPIPRLLVAHRAQVNTARDAASLPLVKALEANNKDLVQFLLDSNASVNPVPSKPDVVLAAAVKTGDLSLVELIVNQYPSTGTDIDGRVIEAAYQVREDTDSMHMLEYFSTGAGNRFEVKDKATLYRPLRKAVKNCDATAMQCLFDMGAEATTAPDDIPLLDKVVGLEWIEGIHMLIAHGADVNELIILMSGTETFLGNAARDRHFDVCKILLEAQADPNVAVPCMPLHCAVEDNNWPLVELLLQYGADPDLACEPYLFDDTGDSSQTAKELVVIGKTDERIVNALFAAK